MQGISKISPITCIHVVPKKVLTMDLLQLFCWYFLCMHYTGIGDNELAHLLEWSVVEVLPHANHAEDGQPGPICWLQSAC